MYKKILFFGLIALCFWNAYPKAEDCISDENIPVTVIMYHNISPKPQLTGQYCVSVEEFERDLKNIVKQGYTTVSVKQLADYYNGVGKLPQRPMVITFDDGQESFYKYAYPLLKKYNCCAVMNVVGSFADEYTENNDHNVDYSYLNWQEIKELAESGIVEIGNHTYAMHEITALRKGCGIKQGQEPLEYCNELNEDIGKLQNRLEAFTGKGAYIFAYPYGYISKQAPDIIKNMGFQAMLTCEERVNYTSEEAWIYKLGRFNRSGKISSDSFFEKINK